MRKDLLVAGEVYHIFNKSIAGFQIFNNDSEFLRMIQVICYYKRESPAVKFSKFIKSAEIQQDSQNINLYFLDTEKEKLVEIVAYCILPTHLHLILKQLKEHGISSYMSNILNSYTRYFNTKHKRKGPLWEGRFKNVLVKTDEQLLHLTRYIHLNPVTAYLVGKPEEWPASSYQEYLLKVDVAKRVCEYGEILDIEPTSYRKFVEDRISYQRELAEIKELLLEES